MGLLNFATRLAKAQAVTFVLVGIADLIAFIAVLTPAWQTAYDTDAHQRVDSGLWIYCPGEQACWYIFSDNMMNYYEKVDVCRFFLIGDCRKKLLKTPYFFGWHYACLIIMLITLALCTIGLIALAISYFNPHKRKIATIVMDVCLGFAFLIFCIALVVFMINAEMLESRYLIGVQNTFEKAYGYSFYIASLALMILMFGVFSALFVTTSIFFSNDPVQDPIAQFKYDQNHPARDYQVMHNLGSVTTV
jgi:ABC-type dipeptide/oligopeptide/nickel transport system permease subunit